MHKFHKIEEVLVADLIKCFFVIQAICALVVIFILRFFDYVVTNVVTAFKPLVYVAILVTIILSLLISLAGHLLAHKARKGSLVPIWINLFTIFLFFLPIKEWGIKFNFNRYYEQRSMIVDEYSDEKMDEEMLVITPQVKGGFLQVSSNDQVIIAGQDGKRYFLFTLYNGILLPEGFICVVDTSFQSVESTVEINSYYQANSL